MSTIILLTTQHANGAVSNVAKIVEISAKEEKGDVEVRVNYFTSLDLAKQGLGLCWQEMFRVDYSFLDNTNPFAHMSKELIENVDEFAAGVLSDTDSALSLEAVQARALAGVNATYTRKVGELTEGYPAVEQASWPFQVSEARAASTTVPTPWLDAAAEERGITREELAAKILALNTPYRVLHGHLTGIRQRLENAIYAEGVTVADVQQIGWPGAVASTPVTTAPSNPAPAPTAAPVSPSTSSGTPASNT